MIGHDIDAALPVLRAQAESLMVTPCVLEKPDGHTEDPENYQQVALWVTVWEPGFPACKVVTSREAREVSVGGQRVTVKPTLVSVPWDAPEAAIGWRFRTPLGVFYVAGIERHSHAVQARYSTVEHQEMP